MLIKDLSEDEKNELRQKYVLEWYDERGRNDECGLGTVIEEAPTITDAQLEEKYGHINFVKDDFWCNQKEGR